MSTRESFPLVPGIVIVDKPAGMSSHDVVSRVRRAFGTRKVGHAGTLDPMATGVLVLGIERGTKILGLLALEAKSYETVMRLGESTTTDDAEGELIFTKSAAEVTDQAIDEHVLSLTGEIDQIPAAVSAIKIDGKRAYQRVRDGEAVQIPPRRVTVSRFEITSRQRKGEVLDLRASVECSSGTYIRSLARDLGHSLGVGGHLTALRRTSVGPFDLRMARTLEQLAEQPHLSLGLDEAARLCFPVREITTEEAEGLRHGKWLSPRGDAGIVAAVGPDGTVSALLSESGERARPTFVFRPAGL